MGGGTSKKKMFRLGGREGVHQLRREGEGKKQSEGFGNGRKGHEKGGGRYQWFNCLQLLVFDHAPLRDGTPLLLLTETNSNIWARITFFPYIYCIKLFC